MKQKEMLLNGDRALNATHLITVGYTNTVSSGNYHEYGFRTGTEPSGSITPETLGEEEITCLFSSYIGEFGSSETTDTTLTISAFSYSAIYVTRMDTGISAKLTYDGKLSYTGKTPLFFVGDLGKTIPIVIEPV